jgi:hypothetical protein
MFAMNFNFSHLAPTPATLTDCHVLIAGMWFYGQLQEQAAVKFKEKAAIALSGSALRWRWVAARRNVTSWIL